MRSTISYLIFILVIVSCLNAQQYLSFSFPHSDSGTVPYKGIDKLTADDVSFQFAIVADRTGGMQPGIFEKAVQKLNLLQPEFVMSVGDLVEGYTLNKELANEEWDEFDAIVGKLRMPFFYVPGNHDFSNKVMAEIWEKRLGPSYYHFQYKNVLFLCLNTEDDNYSGISDSQANYFKKILEQSRDVTWTLVFMHTPLWDYGDRRGYEKIEAALQDRDYTLFSGHHHNYVKKEKNGKKHFVLATTGGGSNLRGAEYGELNHLVWVTMDKNGPVMANIELDGIHDENIVIEEDYPMIQTLRNGDWLKVQALVSPGDTVNELETQLILNNPTATEMYVSGNIASQQGLVFEPDQVGLSVPAGSDKSLIVSMRHQSGIIHVNRLSPIKFTLEASYLNSKDQNLQLSSTKELLLDWVHTCPAVKKQPKIDGVLDDWTDPTWIEVNHPQAFRESWDWNGADDGYFRFTTANDEHNLYIALEAFDDHILLGPSNMINPQDRFTIFLRPEPMDYDEPRHHGDYFEINLIPLPSGKPSAHLAGGQGIAESKFECFVTGNKLSGELAIPRTIFKSNQQKFRLNVAYMDHDNPNNTKPSVLYWRPHWDSSSDYAGSGTFEFK